MSDAATAIRRIASVAALVLLVAAAGVPGAAKSAGPVTDANVAERVVSATTNAEHAALAAYYKAKSDAETPRIEHFEKLYRAYMSVKGKKEEPLQLDARALLKAARMSQREYFELAQAHFHRSLEED
jgi:hypothetical protein